MFRRRRLLRPTSHPPPAGGGAEVLAALAALHARSKPVFRKVFLFEETLVVGPDERDAVGPLVACGLLEERGPGEFAARARVFPVFEKFIAADLLSYQAHDQVLSPMFEQVYLLRNTGIRGGDEVLDLCAGSGVNGIFAAEIARAVTAVDVSPRALAFARFNVGLNAPKAPVALLEGPLLAPVEGRTFDTILATLPFEMLPPGESRFLHSDGGEDGLDVIRACLGRAPRLLSPGGRFEMVAYSPGRGSEPALVGLVEEAFPSHRIDVHVLDIEPLDNLTRPFRRCAGYGPWRRRLEERGYTTNFFLFVRATAGAPPETVRLDPREEVAACRSIAAEWA